MGQGNLGEQGVVYINCGPDPFEQGLLIWGEVEPGWGTGDQSARGGTDGGFCSLWPHPWASEVAEGNRNEGAWVGSGTPGGDAK